MCVLAFAAWQKFVRTRQPARGVALVSLAFVVLTFATARMPLYDLYTAAMAIASSVCCAPDVGVS